MHNFYVGQKVVCVADHDLEPNEVFTKDFVKELNVGQIYTIRWVGMFDVLEQILLDDPYLGIRVEEINRSDIFWHGPLEIPFAAERFRPLIETDISIFQGMLAPVETEELETV